MYVDGFNLYHAMDDLNYNFDGRRRLGLKPPERQCHELKWLDLWALSESFLRQNQSLVSVNYYSAYAHHVGASAVRRHETYKAALERQGVRVVMGMFKESIARCKNCSRTWKKHEEKESDVRIATDLVADALLDRFDAAFLISADSDMKPGIERVRQEVPKKRVMVVAPPNRYSHARDLQPLFSITKGRLRECSLPALLQGDENIERPDKYAPVA